MVDTIIDKLNCIIKNVQINKISFYLLNSIFSCLIGKECIYQAINLFKR